MIECKREGVRVLPLAPGARQWMLMMGLGHVVRLVDFQQPRRHNWPKRRAVKR